MNRDPLFFIALLPPGDIQREVTDFKKVCARLFKASHALKTPPHLTLIPPFSWPRTRLGELGDALDDFALGQPSFEIELKNFSSFPPRVIFVDVVENQQLAVLQLALFHHLKKSVGLEGERGNRFHPHMTIAHRDLKKYLFPEAWVYFSEMEYERNFTVESLVLLEHLRGRWEVREEFYFGGVN
jgi:2'-5' RNA ligase